MNTPRTLALLACLVLYTAGGFAAAQDVSNSSPASIQLTLFQQAPDAIRLEARQAPLGKILKAIADKTGVSIHYSVLPDTPVTATCIGENVSQIMDCLLAKQVGLVAHKPQKDKPAEFWLLGSSVGSCQAVTVEPAATPVQVAVEKQPTSEEQVQMDQALQQQSDLLLEQAKSKDPVQRGEAIANLASGGVIADPNVRKTLEDAMADKDANIRGQAVSTMVNLDKDNAAEILNHALRDKDASVRMSAVDHAAGDVEILQQALADTNADVRNYAAAKLAEIKRKQTR